MWMGTIDPHLGLFGEEPMLPYFGPLVVGEGPTQLSRQRPQFAREGPTHRGHVLRLQWHQHGKPCRPFHQGTERGRIGMAHEQVSLPMPRHRAVRHLGRPLVNADQILNGPRRQTGIVRPTKAMAAAKIPGEFPLQGSAGQHIQIGIDGFMRDALRRVVRISLRQAVRNLFGRPAVREQVQDGDAQARVDGERARFAWLMSPTQTR